MSTVIIAVIWILMSPQAQSPERASSAAELQAAPKSVKKATLNDLASLRSSPSATDAVDMISVGLADADPDVRLSAIYAVAGRASVDRFKKFQSSSRVTMVSGSEKLLLRKLRPRVLALVGDSNERVRQGAVIALVNLEFEGGQDHNDILLKEDAVRTLLQQFQKETIAKVRVEIVKTFTLTSLKSPRRDDILLAAIADSDPDVVQFGVMGLARSTPPAALPKLIELLNNPSRIVRLQLGPAFAAYGRAARPYLDELVRVGANDSDADVRNSLDAAILKIRSLSLE